MQINDRQYETLCAVCDTLIPSIRREEDPTGYWQRKATDLHIPQEVLAAFRKRPTLDQVGFKLLLDLLSSGMLGLTNGSSIKPFYDRSPQAREALLLDWSNSFAPPLRAGFELLRRMVVFYYYGTTNGTENPTWFDVGYPGPSPKAAKGETPIKPLTIDAPTTLHCDVVVVGSGAGGGVVAGELAEAGHDVIVVEKGAYVTPDELTHHEADMLDKLYDQHGFNTTFDVGVTIFAGSTLGGGTTVNWAGSFRTPEHVLQEWTKEHKLPLATSQSLQDSFDAVSAAIGVDPQAPTHNPQNQALWDATTALGYQQGIVPRNIQGCHSEEQWKDLGFSLYGCKHGNKQGTLKTYLQRAFEAGARILPSTRADHIIHSHGATRGIIATHRTKDGIQHAVRIHAKRVVLAAGSLHTPALLLRSGFRHPQLGRNLHLHPAVVVSARYSRDMNSWWGPMMSAYTDEFGQITDNYGVKIETAPVHPGLLATTIPWTSGQRHKERMMEAAKLAHFVIFARDKHSGRVFLDPKGGMRASYKLSKYDLHHLQVGMTAAAHMHFAAGAQNAYIPHNDTPELRRGRDDISYQGILNTVKRRRWNTNRFPLYSAHQMGTCRMGGDAKQHPVSPDGAIRKARNIYIADGSVFPGSCGTNPMLTIMAFAHNIAQGLK